MVDFNKHDQVVTALQQAQEVEFDNREAGRESDHFVNKRDGQWEPAIIANMTNRPRYTFDQCNPILDQISGEVERTQFSIKVSPAGGAATKDIAKTFDGMIRNIENLSGADVIYTKSAERSRETGIAGWRIVQDWVDDDSFDQDLLIHQINNYIDRVWLDPDSEQPDGSDATWGVILDVMSKEKYEDKFPEGSGQSLSQGLLSNVYTHKKESVIIGELLFAKKKEIELVLMSGGQVFKDDEDYQKVKDELQEQFGLTEIKRRKREIKVFYSRLFDGNGWLSKEQETVFNTIPIVTLYSNHKVSENKVIYRSAIEKLMDPQRVYNYAKSRQIEEGALAPRAKYWMTKAQAKGHKESLETLNTNAEPVQFYNHVEGQPPPWQQGGAQVNQGLQATALDAQQDINKGAGMFSANMGDNPGLQTGTAIEKVQNKGDNSTHKYFTALKIAIRYTGLLLVKAIPKVYDTERLQRVVGQDGTSEIVPINTMVQDRQSGEMVAVNDLSQGTYDVIADIGPAFQNKQQEAVRVLIEASNVDPSLMEIGGDVFLQNISAPGMDQIAERKRKMMVEQGIIPESQMTEEELAAKQQRDANPPPPSPEQQAAMELVQAEKEKAQAQTADVQSKAQERQINAQIKQQQVSVAAAAQQQKQQVADATLKLQAATQQQKDALATMTLQQQNEQFAQTMAQQQKEFQLRIEQQILDAQTAFAEQLNTQASTLKLITEAMGADAVISKPLANSVNQQTKVITQAQGEQ